MVAPHPTPYLKEEPLSAVRDSISNVFAATLHIGGSSSFHNLRMHHDVETKTDFSGSTCNKSKIYKLHGLTFAGLGETELVNQVTIVVNCYGIGTPSQECCKSDLSECYCVDITIEFKHMNYFL